MYSSTQCSSIDGLRRSSIVYSVHRTQRIHIHTFKARTVQFLTKVLIVKYILCIFSVWLGSLQPSLDECKMWNIFKHVLIMHDTIYTYTTYTIRVSGGKPMWAGIRWFWSCARSNSSRATGAVFLWIVIDNSSSSSTISILNVISLPSWNGRILTQRSSGYNTCGRQNACAAYH